MAVAVGPVSTSEQCQSLTAVAAQIPGSSQSDGLQEQEREQQTTQVGFGQDAVMDQPWRGSGREPSPGKKAVLFPEQQPVTADSLPLLATLGVTKKPLFLSFYSCGDRLEGLLTPRAARTRLI